MNNKPGKISLVALFIAILFISGYRFSNVDRNEFSWDVLGYYLPLPATFIHHDGMLESTEWIKKTGEKYDLGETLYTISDTDDGRPIYVFLFGMALLYLPFFLLGHGLAGATGYPADGFSAPYQYAMVAGAVLYTFIGLLYFRKILSLFFSDRVAALLILLIVFGTNYIQHLSVKDLETVNVLFMFVCLITWNTIRFYESGKGRYLILTAVFITLMILVKPSEIFVVLIPLLWGIDSLAALTQRFRFFFFERPKLVLLCVIISGVMFFPQSLYWHHKTGHWIYDSYKNPGVGLDLLSPHIADVLFSYKKGWFLYTPLMILALCGFPVMYRRNRKVFFTVLFYFLVSLYIISSWTYWYYGAAYSCRPMITLYPLLAISLGYLLLYLWEKRAAIKWPAATLIAFLVFLNLFQWWQLRNYILDPYRETKNYYWATFLKTSASAEDRQLLSLAREFDGVSYHMEHPEWYSQSCYFFSGFEDENSPEIVRDERGNHFLHFWKDKTFGPAREWPYSSLTSKNHLWIRVSFDIRFLQAQSSPPPGVVFHMIHKGQAYGYYCTDVLPGAEGWHHVEKFYLTPEVRDPEDVLKLYLWNRGARDFDIDNFRVDLYFPVRKDL